MGPVLEEILAEGKYYKNDTEFGDNNNGDEVIWAITRYKKEEDKIYTYDEALNLTGNGWYNISLLFILAFSINAMSLDMFGFAIVVSACACDLKLDHDQTSLLLSTPLLGSIIMAYPWGYISDTQGRMKSLSISLWGSFILASLSALSPNWIVLAVLKCLSSSLSSGAQSMAFTLLGESCCDRTKGAYMIVLTSSLMLGFAAYTSHGYLVLNMDFAYDLGFIIFKPWRMLILTLAMTLGLSGIILTFYYESPKFLVNAGKTEEALDVLRKMKKRNRDDGFYPVKKIILTENNTRSGKNTSLLTSLWDQTVPLIKPPLLQRTIILFYITAAIYSVNNGFFLWIPIIIESFFEETSEQAANVTEGFCDLINSRRPDVISDKCVSTVSYETLLTSFGQGFLFVVVNLGVSMLAHRKKALLIFIFVFCTTCCYAMLFVTNKILTIVFFCGFLLNCLGMGIVFSYFVELYPTSYRGMISCLGMMVARASGLGGCNLIGAYIFTDCSASLYAWGAYTFSGALVSLLLPPDLPQKS
ncbi:uncharacterized protein [Epargyreus clarus]|uniref:uncharacterized protein n=1 Tax=Epargyreus clarus TaxID=520877 RepID=UPI003C2D5A91